MTVKELLDSNGFVTDVIINVRDKDGLVCDQINIGPDFGVEPPYPTFFYDQIDNRGKVYTHLSCPGSKKGRKAKYIREPINFWDEGKDYWGQTYKHIPKGWLDLEVYAWHVRHVYSPHHARNISPESYVGLDIYGDLRENILPEYLEPKKIKQKAPELEGQITLLELIEA